MGGLILDSVIADVIAGCILLAVAAWVFNELRKDKK